MAVGVRKRESRREGGWEGIGSDMIDVIVSEGRDERYCYNEINFFFFFFFFHFFLFLFLFLFTIWSNYKPYRDRITHGEDELWMGGEAMRKEKKKEPK